MRKLTIRKAFKTSCELREAVSSALACIKIQTQYDVNDRLGTLGEVINGLHKKVGEDLEINLKGVTLAQSIRNRIQRANNVPLAYADNQSINDLIGRQATLRALIAWYPEEKDVPLMDKVALEAKAANQIEANGLPNSYSRSNSFSVSGVPVNMRDKLVSDRHDLRVELESVTGQLAYANITETVDLTDEEAEVLRLFRIPV